MTRELQARSPDPIAPESPWGQANPMRGVNHVDTAIAFLAEFPVGSFLSQDAFDDWAQRHGLLNVPTGAPKRSDAWMAHLQRRHHLRYGINQAGAHPRMETPFVVESVKGNLGQLEVRSPDVAIQKNRFLDRVESLCKTKRQQLAYLMQSADWSSLPPEERLTAEMLHYDIEMFQKQMALQSSCLSEKFDRLELRLRRAVESGELRTRNGGIRGIIDRSAPSEYVSDDVD